ncbi:MAG: DUF2752 domain-containing protein [Clostridiaceae bacterium]|nr:DUF2752 domain-containing protein [Clostridiaceae bacterium]
MKDLENLIRKDDKLTGRQMLGRFLKSMLFMSPIPISGFLYVLFYQHFGTGLPCALYSFTGLFCSGCGTGRMFLSILRLDFYQAFRYNPLIFSMLPFMILFFLRHEIAYVKREQRSLTRPEIFFMIFFCISLILFAILRNIPAFSFLAPTAL